jgi:hypothetical protein
MDQPSENDVTCGRGKNRWNTPGNLLFKKVMQQKLQSYYEASSRGEKSRIVKDVVRSVQNSGSRFMKKDNTGKWQELSPRAARTKVAHAIRDHLNSAAFTPTQRNGRNGGKLQHHDSTSQSASSSGENSILSYSSFLSHQDQSKEQKADPCTETVLNHSMTHASVSNSSAFTISHEQTVQSFFVNAQMAHDRHETALPSGSSCIPENIGSTVQSLKKYSIASDDRPPHYQDLKTVQQPPVSLDAVMADVGYASGHLGAAAVNRGDFNNFQTRPPTRSEDMLPLNSHESFRPHPPLDHDDHRLIGGSVLSSMSAMDRSVTQGLQEQGLSQKIEPSSNSHPVSLSNGTLFRYHQSWQNHSSVSLPQEYPNVTARFLPNDRYQHQNATMFVAQPQPDSLPAPHNGQIMTASILQGQRSASMFSLLDMRSESVDVTSSPLRTHSPSGNGITAHRQDPPDSPGGSFCLEPNRVFPPD